MRSSRPWRIATARPSEWVMDRGMTSEDNLEWLREGATLRAGADFFSKAWAREGTCHGSRAGPGPSSCCRVRDRRSSSAAQPSSPDSTCGPRGAPTRQRADQPLVGVRAAPQDWGRGIPPSPDPIPQVLPMCPVKSVTHVPGCTRHGDLRPSSFLRESGHPPHFRGLEV